ncbi:MAG: hypothetical protein AUK44_08105 [Porphyromonadaceae bacterium CG2_30_38_12]|nr:MAG: hypothetical protein AUK44_08105 [Porphyromonadaceae bacterium CG2_30_38_12]
MKNNLLAKLTPHFIAILLFTIISFLYLKPVLEGKQLLGHDSESWMCMAKETIDFNKANSEPTLWTNSMFGGMPTYQISMNQPYNLIKYVEQVIMTFPATVYNLMLYFIGFYILLLAFKFKPWLAIVGSIAFTFASYNFIIILAGHNSKAITIAYMAPLIGAVFSTFRSQKYVGALLTSLFLSLAIRANHVQILYYTFLILLIFGIVEFVYCLKEKHLKSFFQSAGLLLVAALIALGMNATTLLTTYEYGEYTMRGKSNGLTVDSQNAQHGLNKDYITQWSYGKAETLTMLIPNFRGGASGATLGPDSKTAEKIKSYNVPNIDKVMSDFQLPLYWGDQPGTSGPVYLGAIVIFLFVLSFFVVEKRILWWLVPMIVLTTMLSWGKNLMPLTDFFIDNVPLYNKFRTVSMALVAAGFGITLLALIALKELLTTEKAKEKLLRPILISAAVSAGMAFVFALIPSLAGNFSSAADAQFTGDYAFLKATLPLDREALLRADAWRSVLLILAALVVLWLFVKDKLKTNVAVVLFGILFLADLVPVAKRYLNDSNFERKRRIESLIQPSKADEMILTDKSDYRVLDGTVSIFNDSKPSYFHKNIGGYHAAKLRRYQELINMHIEKEIGQLFGAFGRAKTFQEISPVFDSLQVLNMLNMKYIIYNKDAAPLLNPYCNGNAWFVQQVRVADNANDEMSLLGQINTKKALVVDKSYQAMLPATLVADSTASIKLQTYQPNQLIYSFNSATNQLAVFSEIYYDKGWNAYINGAKVPYFRVNYLLRAMSLPKGNYEVVFKFEPVLYRLGNTIALASSIIFILCFLAYSFVWFRKRKVA